MNEQEPAAYAHEPELLLDLTAHPALDEYLVSRGWGRAGVGMWRWAPSLADTPQTCWDITTVLHTRTGGILVGLVGDDLEHAFTRASVTDLARDIVELEGIRYVP